MEVTIYIDVLWIRTFEMELLVCIFVNLWMKQMRPVFRIIWMTALAAIAEVLVFAVAGYGSIFSGMSMLLRMLLLLAIFRPKSRGIFLRLFLWSVLATLAEGGILFGCLGAVSQELWLPVGLVVCAGAVLASVILEERRRVHDVHLHPVRLYENGNVVEVLGLYDTGNRLKDPYLQQPVHILAMTDVQRLHLEAGSGRLIPFSTIGKPDGWMEVWTIDGMEWSDGYLEKIVVGSAPDLLFEGKDYRLILAAGWKGEA